MEVSLRRAVMEDSRFVWEVNNHPSVRAESISSAAIAWERHEAWFATKVVDPGALLFVATCDGASAGVLRFDVHGAEAIISVAVDPVFRRRGVGSRVIATGTEELLRARPELRAVAWIRPGNAPSLHAFARAGYVRAGVGVQDGIVLERFERAH